MMPGQVILKSLGNELESYTCFYGSPFGDEVPPLNILHFLLRRHRGKDFFTLCLPPWQTIYPP